MGTCVSFVIKWEFVVCLTSAGKDDHGKVTGNVSTTMVESFRNEMRRKNDGSTDYMSVMETRGTVSFCLGRSFSLMVLPSLATVLGFSTTVNFDGILWSTVLLVDSLGLLQFCCFHRPYLKRTSSKLSRELFV